MDLDQDAQRGTQVGALYYGAADPDIAENIHSFQRIEETAGARIADHGMTGGVSVVMSELGEIGDVFELAAAVGRFHGDGPVGVGLVRRSPGQVDEESGDLFAGGAIYEEEIARGPGLFHVPDSGHAGSGAGGARVGVRRVGG